MFSVIFLWVWVPWLIGVIFAAIMAAGFFSDTEEVNGEEKMIDVNLAVLGMSQAGKTTFWDFFRDLKCIGQPVATKKERLLEKFEVEYEGKIYRFARCTDINGQKEFVKSLYEKKIKAAKVVLFLFDMNEYFKQLKYKRDVNELLQFISDIKASEKQIILVATHADLVDNRNEAELKLQKEFSNAEFSAICTNLICINMLDKNELEGLKKEVLKEIR